jgi:hypothetical protein
MSGTRRAAKIVSVVFTVAGATALFGSVFHLGRPLFIAATGQRTEGEVTRIVWSKGRGSTSRPVVRFEVEGAVVEFQGWWGSRPPAYSVGDQVPIFYRPENPGQAVIDSFVERYLLGIIFGGIAAFFLTIGGSFWWIPAWLARKRQRIIDDGVPVRATVTNLHRVASLKVDGQSPWVMTAEFTDGISGRNIVCKSHYLWANPTGLYKVGGEVTVYHLPDQPEKYAFQLHNSPPDE